MTVAPRRPTTRPVSTPRPPAQPGRPVSGAAHECPYKGLTPCDPSALAVATRYDKTPIRQLVITRRLRGPVRGAPPDVAPLLRQYDIVIDTIAGYPSSDGSAPKTPARIAAATRLLGRCSRALHPRVSIGRTEDITRVHVDVQANAPLYDRVPGASILGFFGFIVGLWPGSGPLLLPVSAPGCGVRAKGAGPANHDLNALVRVYRAGQWSAKITLPATGQFKLKREGTQRTRTATGMLAHALPNNEEHNFSAREYAAEVRQKLKVSVKRNGVEIPGAQRVTQLISMIASFRDAAMRIFILLQSWPQFGWKFEGSVSVLEGSIEAKWEPDLVMTPECGGRYLPVRTKLEVIANLKLMNASATISFGALADSQTLKSRLEARIEGTVGLSVSTEVRAPFASRPDPLRFNVNTRGFVRARAVGNATVLGQTLADVTATVEGAIALKQGVVSVSGRRIGFRGTLATEAVKLSVEATIGGLGPASVDFEIFPARDLMKWNDAE